MICDKDHSNLADKMLVLDDGQRSVERHKCAGCAYEMGYDCGFNNRPLGDIDQLLAGLPDSQASVQRHKDAREALKLGFTDGQADFSITATLSGVPGPLKP